MTLTSTTARRSRLRRHLGALCAAQPHRPAHAAARDTFAALLRADEPLITHNYVVLETVALTQRRLGLAAVAALRDELLRALQIGWVDRELHAEALVATLAGARREVSFVDRVSFSFMRRGRLTRAFAFDEHFAEHGFEGVPPAGPGG